MQEYAARNMPPASPNTLCLAPKLPSKVPTANPFGKKATASIQMSQIFLYKTN